MGTIFALATFAQKTKSTPVTSAIQDLRADNIPYRLHSDSPLSGTSIYKNNLDSVISQLQTSNEWELSTLSSTARKIFVDFSDPLPGSYTENAPFQSQYVAGRFVTKCYLLYNTRGGQGYDAIGNMTGLNLTRVCP